MKWTHRQRQVIEARGSNLLVSAAAGSGKTAVLVERIISLICDREHPVDIDRLLVMTFTNAAAGEMRERISRAIEEKLMEEPGREHLQVQSALVHRAQITTIDSFCLNLIRDHFNVLDLDPAFRIGDEGELMLLRADVMGEMLEEHYEKGDPAFARFVETYASGKSDSGIEDYIMQIHDFSQSSPFPGEWLERCRRELLDAGEENLEGTAWMKFLLTDVKKQVQELAAQLEGAMEACREADGPQMYLPALQEDLAMVRGIGEAGDYETLRERLSGASFGRLAAARGKNIDPEKKEYASACRDRVKKAVKTLAELYGGQSRQEAVENILGGREVLMKLLELAEEFHDRYQACKRDRNILDFNDLEHEALRVLVKKEGGKICCTEAANELSLQYVEILVDEYQDSNDVQETLIQSLSSQRWGRPNVFMVGDVKQSIYKFRLARPELFMGKYDSYEEYGERDEAPREREAQADAGERAGRDAQIGREEQAERDAQTGREEQEGRDAQIGREEQAGRGDGPSGWDLAGGKKIELNQNFRSRASVLDGVNEIFFQIMTRNLGNIQYTDRVALHAGAVFDGERGGAEFCTELLLADTGEKVLGPADAELEEYTSREIEARMIASKIRELTDRERGLSVWDKEKGCLRRARHGDVVILLRSLSGWTDAFLNVLTQEDVPAFAETGTGYFDTVEVETALAMLAVIDNPIQDIPLAAALRSPMAGMDEEELAWLMAVWKHSPKKGPDQGLYAALRLALAGDGGDRRGEDGHESDGQGTDGHGVDGNGTDGDGADRRGADKHGEDEHEGEAKRTWEELAASAGVPAATASSIHAKAAAFSCLLEELRDQAAYLPIHELIHRMYLRTGYYDYASAMPAGEVRRANLDMLIEKASAYEKTSYRGLFHFIRYIERLKKYDTDFGEATAAGKSQELVRIMSIHKSKGLEFPIVILAGMGKNFNKQDVRGKLLIDADLGIGADYFDVETRTKASTLKKNVLKRKMDLDNLGEELRVLYVAMTRAKEKLILTGTHRHLGKKLDQWQMRTWDSREIPYTILSSASSYLDWLLMCQPDKNPLFSFRLIPVESLVGEAVARKIGKTVSRTELKELDLSSPYDGEMEEFLRERLSYNYPHRADIGLHAKISVSELKKQGQDVDDKNSLFQPVIPSFLREAGDEGRAGGVARGTAFHRVLERLDFSAMEREEDVGRWMEEACQAGLMAKDVLDMVRPGEIWKFLQTPTGRRMSLAHREGRLYREQQFVMGIPAQEMGLAQSQELVLVQGIIDAWMEEEDGLVLVDYKTDRVEPGQEEVLAKRYRVQLEYYKKALEQMVKRPVKEGVLYSLSLQKEVRI